MVRVNNGGRKPRTKASENQSKVAQWMVNPKFPWVLRCAFFLFSFILLGVVYSDALYQYFWQSYFLYDASYAWQAIDRPGGLMLYIGRFLNQLFVHPAIAAALISALLTLLQWWVGKLFGEKKMPVLTYIPSLLILLFLMQVKYEIYWRFNIGCLWSPIIGMFYALAYYALYRKIGTGTAAMVGGLAISTLLFPIIGFYAYLPMLMVSTTKEEWKIWLPATVALWIVAALLEGRFLMGAFFRQTVFAPIVDPYFTEIFIYEIIAALALILFPILSKKEFKRRGKASMLILLTMFAIPIYISAKESNRIFRSEMKMARLADEQDWKGILEDAEKFKNITHTQNAFRVIALANTNQLSQKLFDYPLPYYDRNDERTIDMIISSTALYFHGSMFSAGLQMNMEKWTTFGETYEGLRYFPLFALINDEDKLAERYIEVMSKTGVMSNEAENLAECVGNPKKFEEKYPLYSVLKSREIHENITAHIGQSFALQYLNFSNIPMNIVERRLLADLYLKKLNYFVNDFCAIARNTTGRLPIYFQEAIVLWTMEHKSAELVKRFQVERPVAQRVQEIVRNAQKYGVEKRDQAAADLYPKYKNSYAYYYMFCREQFGADQVR